MGKARSIMAIILVILMALQMPVMAGEIVTEETLMPEEIDVENVVFDEETPEEAIIEETYEESPVEADILEDGELLEEPVEAAAVPEDISVEELVEEPVEDITEEIFAEESGDTSSAKELLSEVEEPALPNDTSGKCGENVYWSLSDDGVLTISGTGEMWDFHYYGLRPGWDQSGHLNSVLHVIIEDGVTYIGNNAFFRLKNMVDVKIGHTVTCIGQLAFWECISLQSVTIPAEVSAIEHSAFLSCSNLETVKIPRAIKNIKVSTFYGCNSLKDVYYSGSKAEWEDIIIETNNDPLLNAAIHFTSTTISLSSEKKSITVNEVLQITAFIDTGEDEETIKSWKWSAKPDDDTKEGFLFEGTLVHEKDRTYRFNIMFASYKPGKYTISLSDDQENEDSLTVQVEEFNLLKYQADHFLNSGAEATTESLILINRSPSRELYETGKTRGLTTKAEAWNTFVNAAQAAEDGSTIIDNSCELKDFYLSFLLNMLEMNSVQDDTGYLLQEGYGMATSLLDSLDILFRADASFQNYLDFDFNNLSGADLNSIIEQTQDSFEYTHRYSIAAIDIAQGIKLVKDYKEWTKLMESFYTISKLSESYLEILKSMRSKCSITENPALYAAIDECIIIMSVSKSEIWDMTLDMWRDAEIGKLTTEFIISKLWGDVKNTAMFSHPVLAAFYGGYKYGMFMSNTFFDTDTLAEKTLKLQMIVEIADLLKEVYYDNKNAYINSRSEEAAKVFLDTATLLFECYDEDCVVAYDFTDTVENAFITVLFRQLRESPEKLKTSIISIRKSMQVFRETVFKEWIFQLEGENPELYNRFKYSVYRNLSDCSIEGFEKTIVAYTGNPIEPDVIIKDGKEILVKDIDYYLEYRNNINVGEATVIIHGICDYLGDIEKTYKIEPSFDLSISEPVLKPGQTSMVTVGGIASGDIVSWASADPSIVTVNSSGLINAVSPGTTTIKITLRNGMTFETDVTVERKLFKDVTDPTAFFYEPIYWAVDNSITTGFPEDNTFRPNNNCNRAAVVTFLWRLAGRPTPSARATFSDLTGNPDFDTAISWAAEKGITTGFNDNTFRPWNICNRAAIVTFLWRYAGRPEPGYAATFKDMTGNDEFDRAISWAAQKGITTGWDDGTFRPWNQCLRLAVVSFLYRFAHP